MIDDPRHRAPTSHELQSSAGAEEKTSSYSEVAGTLSFVQSKRHGGVLGGGGGGREIRGTVRQNGASSSGSEFRNRITQPSGGVPKCVILVILRFQETHNSTRNAITRTIGSI